MSGTIIERRDQVLIGRRSFVAAAFATFVEQVDVDERAFLDRT